MEITRAPIRAVALRYDTEVHAAPEVVAKGAGEMAERILAAAAKHDIPVREDDELLQLLALCEVGDEIPIELYEVVAELLAYLHQLNRDRGLEVERAQRSGSGS